MRERVAVNWLLSSRWMSEREAWEEWGRLDAEEQASVIEAALDEIRSFTRTYQDPPWPDDPNPGASADPPSGVSEGAAA